MADQAKLKRTEAKRQFTRSFNVLENTLKQSDVPIATVHRRFSDVKRNFEEAQKAHDAYIVLLRTEDNIEQLKEDIETIKNK